MAKDYFIPSTDGDKRTWLSNFAGKLPTYAPTVGITDPEAAATQADNLFFAFVCDAQNQYSQTAQNWTAYKNAARSGGAMADMPTTPDLGAAPTAVPPNIFGRVSALAARIKKHPGYTQAMGEDLGIIGPDRTIDPNALKPILKLTLHAGHPNVGWTKQGMDGLEILVDRGTGAFAFLALDTIPDYLDTAPLPAAGSSAVWKYKAIYRLADEQVGQWSDVASLSVMG